MNAIRNLLKDHEEVGKLFNQYVNAGEEAYKQKKSIAEEAIEEILENAEKEEKILFPAFKEKGGEEAEEMVQEMIEEHYVSKFIMEKIKKTKPEDKTFAAKFKVLMETTKHHYSEEELEVFPKAKKALQSELEQLGKMMDNYKKEKKK